MSDPDSMMALVEPVVTEARMLRDLPPWDAEDAPMDLHHHLLEVRARYDRVESILATLIERRTRVRALVHEARENHDDVWDTSATTKRTDRDFMAGRERVAFVNVDVIPQRRLLRRLERTEIVLDGAVESVRLIHRGLDTVRRDLDIRIRLLSLESRLES